MAKVVVDNFELSEEYVKRLLAELKEEKIRKPEDLQRYLKKYSYMNDAARKCHLLISPNEKQESFALPYE
ncbi:MAG TPA: hypothetical protein VFF20_10140 [Pseudogracilibacillus sp.]|nr:hypothetical protein [Pseudogracilibacillus sp.]